jgi:hypothetical protein
MPSLPIPPSQVNAPTTPFNTPTRLFDGTQSTVPGTFSFLQRLPPANPLPAAPYPQGLPAVLTEFAATESDAITGAVIIQSALADPVQRQPLAGSFAAVRAGRILHQYRIGFWSTAGIIDQTVASTAADPTADQIATAYQNFLIFSYLPPALTPTSDEFANLITPSMNTQNVLAALPLMGINTTVVTNPTPDTVIDTTVVPTVLPPNTPFANNLSQFCAIP